MKILHITTELTPLAKAGGLGDIVGYLPKAIDKEFDIETRIIMAKYKKIDPKIFGMEKIIDEYKFCMPNKKICAKISVWKTYLPETQIPVYLIDFPNFINFEDGLYLHNIGNKYDGISHFLYIFISKIAMELIEMLDWRPDVIHYHDSFAALISKWIKITYRDDPFYNKIATVCTIHNLATQPKSPLDVAKKLGFKRSDFLPILKYTKWSEINLTAEAIANADMLNTVSLTYAKEVLTKRYGFGLNKLLRANKDKFTGIINGIDYQNFDPRTNDDTPFKYGTTSLDRKVKNKLYLQKKLGLPQSAETPLICAVTRLVGQKGLDLVDEVLKELVDMGGQFVILGSGDKRIEKVFIKAEKEYPKAVVAELKFDANFAQTIYAGSDMFLMPSRFEPCGLSQIIAMRFGTIPIVRKTGGLADTVKEGYTGFVFKEYKKEEFLKAIGRAVEMYYNQKSQWRQMQIAAMKKDFSWKKSIKKYIWLYKKAIRVHDRRLRENSNEK